MSEEARAEEADEPTTILYAQPASAPGADPDDEQTQILQAPLAIPPATAGENNPYGAAPDDEQTHILGAPHSAAVTADTEEERTTIVAAPVAPPPVIEETTAIHAPPEPRPAPQDATEIMRAVAPAWLDEGARPGARTWFDGRLADFTGALLYNQDGEPRPSPDRRALGAAARDMIERIALRDAPAGETLLRDATLQPGQLLTNTYFVRALIARGGVGEIYRARHRDLKTEHAIKILLPRYALDETLLSLMLEEARLLALVRHEAVVACQGLLRDSDGRPMLVMAYLRGGTLSARLREGPLNPLELTALAQRLAGGLAAIHDQGIVHQDISPDNIMLADNSPAGATIIDFGLARSLADGGGTHRNLDFAGKFSWCSPEQLMGKPGAVDARSDLYSLGLVLAAAGLGYRLDMGNEPQSARAARQSVPMLPGMAEPMAGLVRRLLAPSPSGRPASAREIFGLLTAKPRGVMQLLFGK